MKSAILGYVMRAKYLLACSFSTKKSLILQWFGNINSKAVSINFGKSRGVFLDGLYVIQAG